MIQVKDTLILDELQAVLKRWTNKELPGRRAVSTTMLHNHVLNGSREGVRSHLETGWAFSNAESMLTYVFLGAIESFAAPSCRLARLGHLGDRWRKRQPSNRLLRKERDSFGEICRGIALCDRRHAVIPCRRMVVMPHKKTN